MQIGDFAGKNISGNLEKDIKFFRDLFLKDAVFRIKKISVRNSVSFDCAILFMDGMVNSDLLNQAVIRPLIIVDKENKKSTIAEFLSEQILFANTVKHKNDISEILESLLYGEAVVLIDKSETAIVVDVKGWATRGITEPSEERVLQGPREGFEESSLRNFAMIRRKLLTPDLCIEKMTVGRRSSTSVFVCYLASLADFNAVKKLKKKIRNIDIDGILDINYIIELIRDNRNSFFKTWGTTERPDVVAAKLLEGRIAIVVDGTPVVATVPFLFSENFQSDEDYYQNYLLSSIGRFLRYICFFISIGIPAVFVSLLTFHRQLLPTSFALSVMKLRAGVPFSPFLETIALIFVFEILKEAGVRTSQNLGHALSIVGGLVVGQAAVESRIISAPTLIVVALSGIAGLMLPRLKGAIFYLRILFVFSSALMGLYGFICGMSLLFVYIFSIKSFDVDYTISLSKLNFQSLKDSIIRAPWFLMKERPLFNFNIVRSREKK